MLKKLKVTRSPKYDHGYVWFQPRNKKVVTNSREFKCANGSRSLIVDYDMNNDIIGIEFLHGSRGLHENWLTRTVNWVRLLVVNFPWF